MAQDSFPKGAAAEKPMSDQEWKLLMMAIPDGMIDRCGYPSALKYKKNVRAYSPSVEDALAIRPAATAPR